MENIRISDLNLSKTSRNILLKQNIKYLKDLLLLTDEDLYELHNFSVNFREEIKNYRNSIKNAKIINSSEFEELFHKDFVVLLNASDVRDMKTLTSIDVNEVIYRKADNQFIQYTSLSNRSKNQLINQGFVYTSQIKDLTDTQLEKIKNLGVKSINEIKEFRNHLVPNIETKPSYLKSLPIEKVRYLAIEEVIKDEEILKILKKNNIHLIGTLTDLLYEDIAKLRGTNDNFTTSIHNLCIQLRQELNITQKDLYTLVTNNSQQSIEDIIKNNIPKSESNISIKYLSENKFIKEISFEKHGFSNKEKSVINKFKLYNLDYLLSFSYSKLVSYQSVSKKSINLVLKKLLNQVVVYNKDQIFMGDIARIYLYLSKQKYLLDIKESVLADLMNDFNEIIKDISIEEELSLNHNLDLLLNNQIIMDRLINLDVSKLAKDIAYTYIQYHENLYSLNEIINKLNCEFKHVDWQEILNKLLEQDLIDKSESEKVFSKKPSILVYVSEHYNSATLEIIKLRLEGKTLEEIGNVIGITRERVRQIVKKVLSSTDEIFKEDENAYWFNTYDLDAKQYELLFKDSFYNYLLIRYKKGNKYWNDIIHDDKASNELKMCVRNQLFKGKLELGNKIINKNRTGIINYILEEFCQSAMHISDISQLIKLFIDEQGLNSDEFNIDIRYLENRLNETISSVSQGKKIYRYYNYDQYDWTEFYEELNFEEWKNLEISSLIIFKHHPKLMESYDIRHENELHNVIKRTLSRVEGLEINLSRMPNIKIGKVDREQQVKDLLFEHSPIHIDDFVDLYHENYGIKKQTVKANYLQLIDSFVSDEIINVSYDSLDMKDVDYVRSITRDRELIFIEDIKEELKYEIKDIQLILKYLNYKIFSSYILKKSYETTTNYFNKKFYDDREIIDFNNIDKRLWRLSAFASWLYDKFKEMKMFEFSPKKFITIKKLNEIGITHAILNEFRYKAIQKLSDHKIWSINNIIDLIDIEEINQYGFDPIFYRSILRGVDNIFSNKMGGNYLLKLDEEFSLRSLIEEEISKEKVIDIFDLTQIINEKYDVHFNYYKLTESIKHTDIYYDEIMEKLYMDLDYYYEEFEA